MVNQLGFPGSGLAAQLVRQTVEQRPRVVHERLSWRRSTNLPTVPMHLRTVAVWCCAALLLAACGDDGEAESNDTVGSTRPAAQPSEEPATEETEATGRWEATTETGMVVTVFFPAELSDDELLERLDTAAQVCPTPRTYGVVQANNIDGTEASSVGDLTAVLDDGTVVEVEDPISYTNDCDAIVGNTVVDEVADHRMPLDVPMGANVAGVAIAAQAVQLEQVRFLTASGGFETLELQPVPR